MRGPSTVRPPTRFWSTPLRNKCKGKSFSWPSSAPDHRIISLATELNNRIHRQTFDNGICAVELSLYLQISIYDGRFIDHNNIGEHPSVEVFTSMNICVTYAQVSEEFPSGNRLIVHCSNFTSSSATLVPILFLELPFLNKVSFGHERISTPSTSPVASIDSATMSPSILTGPKCLIPLTLLIFFSGTNGVAPAVILSNKEHSKE